MVWRFLNAELAFKSFALPQPKVWFVVALTLCLSIALFFAPALYNSAYLPDLFPLLEGAWRIEQGQMPHKDFISPVGPASYYLPLWLMKISPPLYAIRNLNAALALVMLGALLYLKKTRLSHTAFLYASLILIPTLLAQINLGDRAQDVTIAMFYNKIGYCFVALVFLFMLKPLERLDIFLISIIILLLFLLKFTFFVAACGLLLFFIILNKDYKSIYIFILCALYLILLQIYNGLTLYYIQDILRTIAAAEGLSLQTLVSLAFDNGVFFLFCVLIPLYFLQKPRVFEILLALYLFIFGLLLMASNAQWGNIFLPLAFLIYLHNRVQTPVTHFCSLFFIAFTLWPVWHNIPLSIYKSYAPANTLTLPIGVLKLPTMSDEDKKVLTQSLKHPSPNPALLGVRATLSYNSSQGILPDVFYAETLREGLSLIATHCKEQVYVKDYGNPFSMMLQKPSVGKILYFYPTRVFKETPPPTFDDVFGKANCVLEPRLPHSLYALNYMVKNYENEFLARYKEIARGEMWIIYKIN